MKTKGAEKMKREKRLLPGRVVLLVISMVLLLWALLPLIANGIFGVGVAVPGAAALCGILWALFWPDKAHRKGWQRAVTGIVLVGTGAVAVAAVAFSCLMLHASLTPPTEGATVIVLGSKIYGSRPSRMLRSRLDAAADYLLAHPGSNCVVAGGLGKGETYTEAEVMKRYLVEDRGISAERIACEGLSVDTHENTAFAMQVIADRGWSKDVAIATQVFHQYRAASNVRSAGATSVGGVPCLSPPHLMLNYWVRECAALCRLWLFRY